MLAFPPCPIVTYSTLNLLLRRVLLWVDTITETTRALDAMNQAADTTKAIDAMNQETEITVEIETTLSQLILM